jgi:hypothetical protein
LFGRCHAHYPSRLAVSGFIGHAGDMACNKANR